jgi:hypothetical protein
MVESEHATDVLECGNCSVGTAFVYCKTMSDGLPGAGLIIITSLQMNNLVSGMHQQQTLHPII